MLLHFDKNVRSSYNCYTYELENTPIFLIVKNAVWGVEKYIEMF